MTFTTRSKAIAIFCLLGNFLFAPGASAIVTITSAIRSGSFSGSIVTNDSATGPFGASTVSSDLLAFSDSAADNISLDAFLGSGQVDFITSAITSAGFSGNALGLFNYRLPADPTQGTGSLNVLYQIGFSLSESHLFDFTGSAGVFNSVSIGPSVPGPFIPFTGESSISLTEDGGPTLFSHSTGAIDFFEASANVPVTEAVVLPAGDYVFTAQSTMDAALINQIGILFATSLDINAAFSPIPEPSRAILLLLGGATAAFRRRKS